MSVCPLYNSFKNNGTTMYVFPSTAEDKNFENQNSNFKMQITHFVLINSTATPNGSFYQNAVTPLVKFKDQLIESLRNYVANHVTVMRNSMIDSTNFYYDTNE